MKSLHWFIGGILCLIASACGSDEPEKPYTGPWEIYYEESYWGLHNNSNEFNTWLAMHKEGLLAAKFSHLNGNSVLYSEYVTEEDYSEFYSGDIAWCEVVDCATEDEIKQMTEDFIAFTIENKVNRTFDRFFASYQRYGGNDN